MKNAKKLHKRGDRRMTERSKRALELRARAPLRILYFFIMLLPFSPHALRTPMSRSRRWRLRASASAASRRAR
eukprot:6179801-Pleurochrysis_carterae.AAC.1